MKFQVNFSNGESCEIDEWGLSSEDEEDYEMEISVDIESDGYSVPNANPVRYYGKDTWKLEVLAEEGSLLEGEDGKEYELSFHVWEGIEGDVVVAEKGKEYDLTSAGTQDYLLIPNIKNQ